MITTGYPRTSATRKTEVVDVANGATCSDLAVFPVELSEAVGANLDGTPVVCGGYVPSIGHLDKCYRFANGVWEEFGSMMEKRYAAAGVIYNKKLHVFGGGSGGLTLHTSETINIDGEVSDGPDLPTGVRFHAMTSINNTVSLLSGGWLTNANSASAQTWYYNHETETFTSGPDLMIGRYGHGSAIIPDS